MIDAWTELKQSPARYNMLKHNCSTVVATILETGSGVSAPFTPTVRVGDHVVDWKLRLLFRIRFLGDSVSMWTPDEVLRYVRAIEQGRPRP